MPVKHSEQSSQQPTRSVLKPISFPGFYNAIYAPRGFKFPAHLVPVAASLADPRIDKLMVIVGPGSGKSMALSIAYPAYAIGLNPDRRILGISGSEDLPRGFLQATMGIIEHSPHFKRLFPDVLPEKDLGWSTEKGMFVKGHPLGDPDPTYYAAGMKSKAVVGKHATTIILDDLHTEENSTSREACESVIRFYYNTALGRMDPLATNTRMIIAGRRWSEWDIYGHLMESGSWVCMRLPFERPGSAGLWQDIYVPPDFECCWTQGGAVEVESDNPKYRKFKAFYGIDPQSEGFYWPDSAVKRKEYFDVKRNQPAVAASTYQCQPGARESGIFIDSDFEKRIPIMKIDHLTPTLVKNLLSNPGARVIQAWDTASKTNPESDWSVCFTGILIPCSQWHAGEDELLVGPADSHFDVVIVDRLREKFEIGALMKAMRTQAALWSPQAVVVEDKSSGIQLIQALTGILPIVPIKANVSKRTRATVMVEGGTASVQGWMRQGRVSFWAEAPWLEELMREMKDFSGDGLGADDQTDSLIHLLSHAITLGTGQARLPSPEVMGDSPSASPDILPTAHEDSRARLASLGVLEGVGVVDLDPFHSSDLAPPAILACMNCQRWDKMQSMCSLHRRKTVAFDYCEAWSRGAGQ